jgi:hypothetical protein
MIEELRRDYGIEKVVIDLEVIKLKDNSIKTAIEQTRRGNASPLGKVEIMPRTHDDTIIRSVQGDIFTTGFHELKHMKQFAEAYRANPYKFAEAIYKQNITEEAIVESVNATKNKIIEKAKELKETTCKGYSLDDIVKQIRKNSGMQTDNDIRNKVIEATQKDYRTLLDARFGKLDLYKEGTAEYKKGMEYIKGYEEYPNPDLDYEAYRENILEKEAWHIADMAKKIYKYASSIWKL